MIIPTKEWLDIFRSTNGALSVSEAIAIMNIAAQAPQGLAVELGVYKGKSSISAIIGFESNREFFLVEPEFEDKEWLKEVLHTLNNICYKCSREVLITPSARYSTEVLPDLEDITYCFVDSGSHQDGLPMQEVRLLEDRMVQGGIIAFHDFRSQFIEVEDAYNYLLGTGKYQEIIIDWGTINNYVNDGDYEIGNTTWHHTEMKNPNFVGALRRK